MTVDHFGHSDALALNESVEFERNSERFRFFRWAQQAFRNLRVIPPSTGIMHQINMEFLSSVVATKRENGADLIQLDLSTVEPCLAGPKRPQDKVPLADMKGEFQQAIQAPVEKGGYGLSESERLRSAILTHPSGSIKPDSPAGVYLQSRGVRREDFNSYPSRRGNHHVMMRGTFANVRIRNRLVPHVEGGVTLYHPTEELMSIYDAAIRYKENNTPLTIIAGKEYGTGSSRDWAAKGPYLLGVRMIIAESYERIHRSNLVGMGILPLQFAPGTSAASVGIRGDELFDTMGLHQGIKPGQTMMIKAARTDGSSFEFEVIVRLDNAVEIEYYRNGGIMQTVVRRLLQEV